MTKDSILAFAESLYRLSQICVAARAMLIVWLSNFGGSSVVIDVACRTALNRKRLGADMMIGNLVTYLALHIDGRRGIRMTSGSRMNEGIRGPLVRDDGGEQFHCAGIGIRSQRRKVVMTRFARLFPRCVRGNDWSR